MKKHLIMIAVFICLALSLQGCPYIGQSLYQEIDGSGKLTSEERPVTGVKYVELSLDGDLMIEIGEQERLVIEAEDNLLPYILTDIYKNELHIHGKEYVDLRNTKPIRYMLTVQALDGLSITSSGEISTQEIYADNFSIRVSYPGNVNISALNAEKLDVEITGSGNVNIATGEVTVADIRISSMGKLDMQGMVAQTASINLSSYEDAHLWVSKKLNGRLTSSGNVYLKGDPKVNVHTTSSGKVIKQ